MRKAAVLFLAQGFGFGRIPVAPGTWGTLPGIAWFAALVAMGNPWLFVAGALGGVAVSVWLCGAAEKLLGQTDPGSIVLDEIVAVPFCFLPWLFSEWTTRGHVMPPVSTFFTGRAWLITAAVFALFRVFDIWKPWPIRRLQHLPGGWGVTVDDLLAAIYVAIVTLAFVL